jgi:hypothetical protein
MRGCFKQSSEEKIARLDQAGQEHKINVEAASGDVESAIQTGRTKS